jgi:2-polyprenyl-3-methyl-5-hydroxy-6-metoxy-1,4-benzoquinol methylase
MDDNRLGFKIEKVLELNNFKVLEIGQEISFDSQLHCPSDGVELKTICTLIGNDGKQKLRIGGCSSCGYVGYVDRPTKTWISNFYLTTWDGAQSQDVQKKTYQLHERLMAGHLGKEREVLALSEKWPIDRNRYICEIGCGYGELLKQMEQLGFTKLIGIENSLHRAEFVKQALNMKVLTSPFEDQNVQSELKKFAPLSLIIAYHVLEHTYNPAEVIQLATRLQTNGDYLIISVPNLVGEPSMGVLAYLPHLHSFTTASLERLLNNNGYGIIDDSLTTSTKINLVAKRVESILVKDKAEESYFDRAVQKFIGGLDLARSHWVASRRLWWFPKADIGGQSFFFKNGFVERWHWRILRRINGRKHRSRSSLNSILISDLSTRYTLTEDSPLEIQFEGNIKLFYK